MGFAQDTRVEPGPAAIAAERVRAGRRFATATARLESGGRAIVQALATFGDLAATERGPERVDAAPPELPPPDACPRNASEDPLAKSFMHQVDLRLHPEDVGFRRGAPSGEPRVRGWFRFADGAPIDTLALVPRGCITGSLTRR